LLIGCGNDHALPGQGGGDGPDANTGGGGGVDAAVNACSPNFCVDIKTTPSLQAVDGTFVVVVPNDKIIVVRTSDTTFATLSDICTHARCAVGFSTSLDHFKCPCHGSEFGLDGSVLRGPALRPLKVYANSYDATTEVLTITLA
jgi:cytochrome b6-f complex iron-sulfur subunit